jgi:excisionase family DNA binding protein
MLRNGQDSILTTQEACDYLRISRPTYLKYLHGGKIKAAKVGKGWKVLKSELNRFLNGGSDNLHLDRPCGLDGRTIREYVRSQEEA